MRFIGGCVGKLTKEKRNWMIGSAVIIICFIAFFGLIYWLLFWTGSTKNIEATANQLDVDTSWTLDMENINPPQAICIGIECPSLYRNWKTNQPIDRDTLESLFQKSKWNMAISDDCSLDNRISGSPAEYCSAVGLVGNYEVRVDTAGSISTPEEYYLRLAITEKD